MVTSSPHRFHKQSRPAQVNLELVSVESLADDKHEVEGVSDARVRLLVVIPVDVSGIRLEPRIRLTCRHLLVKLGTLGCKQSLSTNQSELVPTGQVAANLWAIQKVLLEQLLFTQHFCRLEQDPEVVVQRVGHENPVSVLIDKLDQKSDGRPKVRYCVLFKSILVGQFTRESKFVLDIFAELNRRML